MLNKLIAWLKKDYQVLNRIEISKSRLIENYSTLSKLNSTLKIAPVLKSNAYGHGIFQIGAILDTVNAPFLCVDSLYEAFQLHKPLVPELFSAVKVKTPILVMGYTNPSNLRWRELPFQWAVWDLEFIKALDKYQKGALIHVFVDTGMHREGVDLPDLADFLKVLKEYKNIEVVGLMSHLASCSRPSDPLFLKQIKNFKKAKEIVKKSGFKPKYFHLSASDPLMNPKTAKVIANVSNLARTGKALYGIAPKQMKGLKPILSLKTKIVQIKKVRKGESIGYGGTYKTKREMVIGVLPIGYNDGVDRRLSNLGVVLINNKPCKIVGRVSMNVTSVDLSKIKDPFIGQEVVVYSNNHKEPNSIEKVAKLSKTIAHEILIREAPSTRRIIVP